MMNNIFRQGNLSIDILNFFIVGLHNVHFKTVSWLFHPVLKFQFWNHWKWGVVLHCHHSQFHFEPENVFENDRVFANGPGDRSSIPGQVIPKTQKMVLDAALLNSQHYKVRIKGKVEQSRERSSAFLYTSVWLLLKRDPSGHHRLRTKFIGLDRNT